MASPPPPQGSAAAAFAAKRELLVAANARFRALIQSNELLTSQLTENRMVQDELDVLKDDEPVFQLHGKVLVRQDHGEAKSLNAGRIKLITGEIKKVEMSIAEVDVTRTALQKEMQQLQIDAAASAASGGEQ